MNTENMFNENILKLKPSASVAMTDRAREMKTLGIDVISLSGGEPDFDTPKSVVEAGIRAIKDGHTHYCAGRGILPLRERIAVKLNEENGIKCTAENILVTPGGKIGVYQTLFTLINPGDQVIILDPSWVSYAPMVVMAGGVPVHVSLSFENNYIITQEALAGAYTSKTKILIVNSPNNPTGRVMTSSEAETIRKFVREHNITVIADEVYEKIIFDSAKHISLGSFEDIAPDVVTVNSFSKSVAMTGWRVGYICASKQITDKIYLSYQHSLTCISEFSQIAAIRALDCDSEIEAMRQSYEKRRNFAISRIKEIPGFSCIVPQGAFYAWCKIEQNKVKDSEICSYILENAKVACIDGSSFGKDSKNCIRMCFAASEKDLEEAIRRIGKVFCHLF